MIRYMLICYIGRQDLEQLKVAVDKFIEAFTSHTVGGVIVTLKGSKENDFVDLTGTPYDFGSRFFAPWAGVLEDPVCGEVISEYLQFSAHG